MACDFFLVQEHIVTSYPALVHAAQRWTPIRPVPPIIDIVGSSSLGQVGGAEAREPFCDNNGTLVITVF